MLPPELINERNLILYSWLPYCISPILLLIISGWIYAYSSNNSGALRDSEKGPKWQLAEYIKRQSLGTQITYKWLGRAKWICFLSFCLVCLGGFLVSVYTQNLIEFLLAYTIAVYLLTFIPIINGIDALTLKAAIFPRYLWAGKREFATGKKARFAAYSRIVTGVFLFVFWLWAYGTTLYSVIFS